MRTIIRNKKGDVTDYITWMVVIFFLAVSFLIVAFANDKLKGVVEDTALNETSIASDIVEDMDRITTTTVQNGFAAVAGILILGMMISAFMVRIHPVFLFMYIVFLAVSIFVCVPLANAYQLLTEAETLATIAAQQTIINWFMEHLIMITLGVGVLSMIVTFAKLGAGGTNVGDI